jgi:hypothetical protein
MCAAAVGIHFVLHEQAGGSSGVLWNWRGVKGVWFCNIGYCVMESPSVAGNMVQGEVQRALYEYSSFCSEVRRLGLRATKRMPSDAAAESDLQKVLSHGINGILQSVLPHLNIVHCHHPMLSGLLKRLVHKQLSETGLGQTEAPCVWRSSLPPASLAYA